VSIWPVSIARPSGVSPSVAPRSTAIPASSSVPREAGVAVGGGHVKRGPAVALPGLGVGAGCQQQLQRAFRAGARGGDQRRRAVVGGGIWGGPGGQQFGDHRRAQGIEGGVDQRRVAVAAVAGIDRRARRQQRRDHRPLQTSRREVQRRVAVVAFARLQRRAGGDQQPGDPVVAFVGGVVQGGPGIVRRRGGGVGAARQQQLGDVVAAVDGRCLQGRVAAGVAGLQVRPTLEGEVGEVAVVAARRLVQRLVGDVLRRRAGRRQQQADQQQNRAEEGLRSGGRLRTHRRPPPRGRSRWRR
jgi:hypothetical protein